MSTTIPIGLEIRRLVWKDDSFRMADHEPTVGYGTLGWWDNTTGNAITFTNINGAATDTLNGGVTTYGPFGPPSLVWTNGDELTLPGNTQIEKDFPEALPADTIGSVRLRAKTLGGTPTLTITFLDSTLSPMLPTFSVTLSSTTYTHYTFAASPYSDVWGIRLECSANLTVNIDYVAFGSSDYINQGGISLNVSIPKKTQSQTIPNDIDIIQQLGISSRSKAVVIEKVTTDTFDWLEDKQERAIPLELMTPTQQATGYVSDLKRHSEAGWVSRPLPSSDSLNLTNKARQLYDVSFSLVKSDGELNIDITGPIIPPSPPSPIILLPTLGSGLKMVTNGTHFYVSTTTGEILKMDKTGTVVATTTTGYSGVNAYCLWYDGSYLYANCYKPTGGTHNPVYKLNPTDLSVVGVNNFIFGGEAVMTLTPGGNIYFTRGIWLQEYNPTLTVQLNQATPAFGNAGYEMIYDGTNIWWMGDSLGGLAVLDTSLSILKYATWPVFPASIGTLAYIGGTVYGGDNKGNVYSMVYAGGVVTFTHILIVPNASPIAGRMTLIGNKVYIATASVPATVYIYNYPAWTLATTKTLPDSETVQGPNTSPNTGWNPYSLLSFNGYPMILTQDAIYNIDVL